MSIIGEINWQLIAMLVAVSAIVAYVGDVVGMRIGKRRISIFGLRPRYTSTIITTVTGIVITLCTLLVVSFTSDTVRSAVLGMKFMQRQVTEVTAQLQKSREELEAMEFVLFSSQQNLQAKEEELERVLDELQTEQQNLNQLQDELDSTKALTKSLDSKRVALEKQLNELGTQKEQLSKSVVALNKELKSLQDGMQHVREGRIAVLAGEVLSQVVASPGDADTGRLIDLLVQNAKQNLSGRMDKGAAPQVKLAAGERAKLVSELSANRERTVLRLVSRANAVSGEAIGATVQIYPSRLIYKAGTVLAETEISPSMTEEKTERALYALLQEVNQASVKNGVIPDPLRGTVGSLGATDFFEAVEKISSFKSKKMVVIVAGTDVYSEGPVRVKIEFRDM